MIRQALVHESDILTEISFASKKHWAYPEEYYDIWRDELTILPDYITKNEVYVYDTGKEIAGYYSLVELQKPLTVNTINLPAGLWLEHMFLLPEMIGQGLGRELFQHCIARSRCKQQASLRILADPNAQPFYLKMGCRYIKEFPSSIKGRTTPYLEYPLRG